MPEEYDSSQSKTKLNRRQLLKTAGTGGIAVTTMTGLGTAGNSDRERVPKVLSQGKVVEWMEIPAEWREQHNRAKQANKRLTDEMFQHEGVVGCGMIRAPERYGGKPGFQLEVTVDPDKFDGEIPDRFDGTPVVREETTDYGPSCYNDNNYWPMPGGVWISGNYRGTSCCKVRYNGTTYMLTAAHLFGGNCTGYNIGEAAYQRSQRLGSLEGYYTNYDIAIVSHDYNNISLSDNIEGENNSWDIKGYASESNIADRVVSPVDSYRKMGTSTGITSGGIGKKDYSINHCFDFNNEGVRGNASANDGDSGGPAFSVDSNGQATMLYTVSWKEGSYGNYNSCTSSKNLTKCAGTAAYRTNNLNYTIVS